MPQTSKEEPEKRYPICQTVMMMSSGSGWRRTPILQLFAYFVTGVLCQICLVTAVLLTFVPSSVKAVTAGYVSSVSYVCL